MNKETNILIDDLRSGKRSAQELLLTMYGETVFRQITRIVTQLEDAEEVYQDVFVKAFKKIDTYNQQASLATWLSRIAYNESLNFVRNSKKNMVYVEDHDFNLEEIEDIPLSLHDEQTILLMEKALEHLPPNDKAIITMFYYDNMSMADIAYVTGSIPSTVGSQLSRIRKKLYRIIKNMQQ